MSAITFEESWETAEKAVFEHLIRATGSKNEESAFLGYLPPMVPCWALNTGRSENEQTLWSPDVVSVHLNAALEFESGVRSDCLRWGMQIVKALTFSNIDDGGNVQSFRIRQGGFGKPEPNEVILANGEDKVLVFSLMIGCELVFSTGGRL